MKTSLDSYWLRAVQLKRNDSAKSVTPVQIHIVILDYEWLEENRKFSMSMISRKMNEILCGNLE